MYLKIKYPFAKLHPFFHIWNSVVKAALSQSQHLLGKKKSRISCFVISLHLTIQGINSFYRQTESLGVRENWRHKGGTFTHCICRT